jgi:hypothetical protein
MAPRIEQSDQVSWPSGHATRTLHIRLEPDDLTARFGLNFADGYDQLDVIRFASAVLDGRAPVEFVRHRGAPVAGTEVLTDAAADVAASVALVADVLDLTDEDIIWVRPATMA